MAVSLVQSKHGSPDSIAFDATPTVGNLIVAYLWAVGTSAAFTGPAGFTSSGTYPLISSPGDHVAVLWKFVTGTEPSPLTFTTGVSGRSAVIAEFSGVATLGDTATLASSPKALSGTVGPVTVARRSLLIGLVGANNREGGAVITGMGLTSGWTTIYGERPSNNLYATAGYRLAPVGDHSLTGSLRDTSDWSYYPSAGLDASGWAGVLLAFPAIPYAGVYADWDNDGFGDPGSDDDLTGDVESWVITRGASAEITGGAQPGTARIILNNPADDRYNPLNTSGPLYGKLHDGVPIWVGVNSDGAVTGTDPRGLFGGRITDITPLPVPGASRAPKVQVDCEDALGWYGRTPARVADATGRSQGALRQAILTAIGETRTDLASEIATMPLSSWGEDALPALEAINRVNGSRHFAKPGGDTDTWYRYTTRNRQWRLDGTVDATLDAGSQHVTGSTGWRLSADTVINQQKASVTPVSWTSSQTRVWEADQLPIGVTTAKPYVKFVEFDDFVDTPVANWSYTGSVPTVTLTHFGRTAKLQITSAGTTSITHLVIEGRLARRLAAESAVEDNAASQAPPRGVRAGSEISGDFVGVLANAQGIAAHVVWRYGSPQYRPTIVVENWIPQGLEIDLYDVVSVTVAELGMTARRFEVVGLTHESSLAASASVHHHVLTLVLQECRVQSDPGWFVLDSSLLDGAHLLAY